MAIEQKFHNEAVSLLSDPVIMEIEAWASGYNEFKNIFSREQFGYRYRDVFAPAIVSVVSRDDVYVSGLYEFREAATDMYEIIKAHLGKQFIGQDIDQDALFDLIQGQEFQERYVNAIMRAGNGTPRERVFDYLEKLKKARLVFKYLSAGDEKESLFVVESMLSEMCGMKLDLSDPSNRTLVSFGDCINKSGIEFDSFGRLASFSRYSTREDEDGPRFDARYEVWYHENGLVSKVSVFSYDEEIASVSFTKRGMLLDSEMEGFSDLSVFSEGVFTPNIVFEKAMNYVFRYWISNFDLSLFDAKVK